MLNIRLVSVTKVDELCGRRVISFRRSVFKVSRYFEKRKEEALAATLEKYKEEFEFFERLNGASDMMIGND